MQEDFQSEKEVEGTRGWQKQCDAAHSAYSQTEGCVFMCVKGGVSEGEREREQNWVSKC